MHELIDLLSNSRWFMEPAAFRAVSSQIAKLTPDTVHAAMTAHADRGAPAPEMLGDIAVIPMSGPIIYRSSWLADLFGFATVERMRAQLQAALVDPAVRTICFRCNSPGGVVDMVPEFADDIFAARGQKPIIFVADPLIASCAYWLASQGDQIIATRSSRVGAIGTYCEHEDLSGMLEQAGIKVTLIYHGARKVDANPYEPLSDEARADLQQYVDQVGTDFETAVARGRGVAKKVVIDTFGQGKVFTGLDAIGLGMADKKGTWLQTLARLAPKARGSARGELAAPVVAAAALNTATVDPVENATILAGKTHKTGMGSRQDDGCNACSEACPCDRDECPEDCQDCDDDCPCRKDEAAAKAKAESLAIEAADRDAAAIMAALRD